MYVIGYKPIEIFEFLKLLDLNKLKNFNISNLDSFGLDTGKRMDFVLQKLIANKGHDININLSEIYKLTKKKIIFTTVCVNTMEPAYISYESHPDLPLYLAIRMSSAIPVVFSPVLYNNQYYIDGGCFDNFPINLFQDNLSDLLGLLIIDNKSKIEKIENIETYISQVISCMMEGMTYLTLNMIKPYEANIIKIISESTSFLNFEIDTDRKLELFQLGYDAVINKFKISEPEKPVDK